MNIVAVMDINYNRDFYWSLLLIHTAVIKYMRCVWNSPECVCLYTTHMVLSLSYNELLTAVSFQLSAWLRHKSSLYSPVL